MTLQKIRTKSTGHLTSLERDIFAKLVDQSNSNFRVKAGSVADVSLEALDPGAIVYNEADGKIYFCDDEWWNPAGVPIKLKVVYTDTQFAFKFKAPSGSTLQIYDGDGTLTPVAGNDAGLVTHNTSYAAAGTYYFYVEGDYLDLTVLNIAGQSFVSGDISGYGVLTNLTFLLMNFTGMYGNIEVLRTCTELTILSATNNVGIYGDASRLDTFGNITLSLYNTAITFDSVVTMTKTDKSYEYGSSSGLTSAMIDNIFNSYAASTGMRIQVWNNSSLRTAASSAAILTLIQAGNKVGFDYVGLSLGSLGSELHIDANAASDPNANEANAVTGWTPTGLSGSNEFVSQEVEKSVGNYAFKAQCNGTPTSNANFAKSFTVDSGSIYRIVNTWKHIGSGGTWGMWLYGGAFAQMQVYDLDWQKLESYYKATDTSFEVKFIEYSVTNDGGVYVDDISFRKLTPS